MKPGDTYKMVLLNPDRFFTLHYKPVDRQIFNSLSAKKKVVCPICESDRIESRFEILDL